MPEDVVIYKVDGRKIDSYVRGSLEGAIAYCRRPPWPAQLSDHFIGVGDWGHDTGTIVCSTPELSNWVGKSLREFRSVAH